jgi:molecular chaperone DnaJ
MEKVDLYKALEVSKDASQDEIRRSYRRLARKYHPDANPGDRQAEERFKEIQHAYDVLSKPEKRREYDEGPRTFFGSQGAGQGRPGGADFEDISDLLGGFGNLGDIFGRATGATQRTPAKGENITVNIRLSFKRGNDAGRGAGRGGVRRVQGHGGRSWDYAADVSRVWWQGSAEP